MTTPAIQVVRVAGSTDPLVDTTLDYWLGPTTTRLRLDLPAHGLPKQLDQQHRATWKSFTATPQPLRESWRIARQVEAMTSPGDTVVFSDRSGTGALCAIEQAGATAERRRRTIVVAGESRCLALLAVAGTIDGVGAELEYEIDQELAAYRFADLVITLSPLAVDLLASLGIAAVAVGTTSDPSPGDPVRPTTVSIPESFSRLAATPTILRAIAGLPDESRPKMIAVSLGDHPDLIWSGTAWDAAAGPRQLLGSTLRRGTADSVDAVVLGHPFALPPEEAELFRQQGAHVLVREGSTSSLLWPDAVTWQDEDQLASLLRGEPTGLPKMFLTGLKDPVSDRRRDDARAQRVSAGVPVFADTRYLNACLESLLAQTQPFHEIVLIDDGSRSPLVTSAMEEWHQRHPQLIRVLTQPNRGVSVARNSMLEQMIGDAFVLVDADDELDPDFVGSCGDVLRADSSVSAVATWTEFFGEYQGVEAKPPLDIRVGRRENTIISTCALVDMGIRDAGVRFTPDLAFLFCEDWDFWCQILASGGRFGLVPRPLARHRVHRSSGGFQRTPLAQTLGQARATARLGGPRLLPSSPA
jgi:Glycosyl transferase family 2